MRSDLDETQRLLGCPAGRDRQHALAEIFQMRRKRLRLMLELRLDPRLRARFDPSDVLQEAVLEVSRRLEEYLEKPPMPLFLWFRRITLQALIASHRKHLGAKARSIRREVPLDRCPPLEPVSSVMAQLLSRQATSPSQKMARDETRRELEKALEAMDPVDRELIALRHFEQLSNSEIAGVLGMQESTASQRYFRALFKLRKILGKFPGDDRETPQ